ncbi:MAG: hypothetical protein AAGF93_13190 [Cyanobacteria bacterium P01_H01_bin.105]
MILIKRLVSQKFFKAGLVLIGIATLVQDFPGLAQENRNVETELLQRVLPPTDAEGLAVIREAPLSERFIIPVQDGIEVYAIKDKDFDPNYDKVGFYSLWGSLPDYGMLQMSVFYCFRNPAIAGAELEKVTLMDDDEVLLTIDQKFVTTEAESVELISEHYETIQYADPFFDPFWGTVGRVPYGVTRNVYVPAVDCSVGGGRFDLIPVRDKIADFPNKTLDVRLLFSNGVVENWRLGKGTVREIKALPIAPEVIRQN